MVDLNICIGSSCHLKGSYNVIQIIQQLIEAKNLHDKVEMKAQFCIKQCQNGVAVMVNDELYSVSPENAKEFFESTILPMIITE